MMSEAKIEDPGECQDATPYQWRVRCTSFERSRVADELIGFATFLIWDRLILSDARVYRTPHGVLAVKFRRLGVLCGDNLARRENGTARTVKPVSFVHHADMVEFSAAAVSALRAAFPDAIPAEAQRNAQPECQAA